MCIKNGTNMLSMSTGATASTDLLPMVERDLTTTPVGETTTATETSPSTDSLVADNPCGHIQCLLDGLPDDLTIEQRAHATAFIWSRSNVFSRSEYDIGRTRIIPHHIDTGDNAPHFEQL